MIDNTTSFIIEENSLLENTTLAPISAGLPVTVDVNLTILEEEQQYFFRLQVEDFGGLTSWSNIPSVYNHIETPQESSSTVTTPLFMMVICVSNILVLF